MLGCTLIDLPAALGLSGYATAWLKALIFTWAVEVGLGVWLLRAEAALPRRLVLLFVASAVTHPCVWFVFPFIGLDYVPAIILAEIFAVVVEATIYWAGISSLLARRALAVSFVLNGASLGLGLLVRELWGWV